jgi:hypothetical protein
MRLHNNPVYLAIAGELNALAIPHHVVQKGKHQAMIFLHNNRKHSVSFAVSPSDWRAPFKARSYVRRLLKQAE